MQSGVLERKSCTTLLVGKPGGFSCGDHVNFADVFLAFGYATQIAPFF